MKKPPKTKSDTRETRCAYCDLELSEFTNKQIVEIFNLHRKCRKELEAKMAQCACGNQDLTYKTGISKKTGKKWQGWKCEPCDLMMGMNGVPWGTKASPQPQNGTKTAPVASSLEVKVDKILSILQKNFPTTQVPYGETEEEIQDPSPF